MRLSDSVDLAMLGSALFHMPLWRVEYFFLVLQQDQVVYAKSLGEVYVCSTEETP